MSLSSIQLDAFQAVASVGNFSAAAARLGLTQSALSQRVLNLERELRATLFLRDPSGPRLTETGIRLLRYCETKRQLEGEFLRGGQDATIGQSEDLVGEIRIAGFSTVMRSIVLPAVADLVRNRPLINVDLQSLELRELPGALVSGRVDWILLNRPLERDGIESLLLGQEEYVLVKPSGKSFPKDVMLDHDMEDSVSSEYFRAYGPRKNPWKRHFLDEIYSIIEGVRLGMGSAVVPRHLLSNESGIRVISSYRPHRSAVYLCRYRQAFDTRLRSRVLDVIRLAFAKKPVQEG